jgi:hypothetical protein
MVVVSTSVMSITLGMAWRTTSMNCLEATCVPVT